jgi:hypothetical protein
MAETGMNAKRDSACLLKTAYSSLSFTTMNTAYIIAAQPQIIFYQEVIADRAFRLMSSFVLIG